MADTSLKLAWFVAWKRKDISWVLRHWLVGRRISHQLIKIFAVPETWALLRNEEVPL